MVRPAALLSILAASACSGSSAAKPPPRRAPWQVPGPQKDDLIIPRRDCAGPMAWKCGDAVGPMGAAAIRRTPRVPAEATVPDAVEAGPLVYRVVIDNDRVRVLSVKYAKGRAVPPHRHPDRVVYDPATGAAEYLKAGTHEVDGAAAGRAVVIELARAGDRMHARAVQVSAVRPTTAVGDLVLYATSKGTLLVAPPGGEPERIELQVGTIRFFPTGSYRLTTPGAPVDLVLFAIVP